MKNVLILPIELYTKTKETANKQGLTIVELCQKACVCKIDEVVCARPVENCEQSKTVEDHGLEA